MKIDENNDIKKKNNVSSGKACRALDYSDQDSVFPYVILMKSWSE